MKEKGLKFYEEYKPLPTTTRKRITAFRKALQKLTDVSRSALLLPTKQPVRIQFSTPVLRSQEGRKLGTMSMFAGMNTTRATTKFNQLTTPRTQATKISNKDKEITRMTVSKKKLERNAIVIGHRFSYKEEEFHSPLHDSKGYSQANLLANKKKVDNARLKKKMKTAVKYLIEVATVRKTIRGNKEVTISENKREEIITKKQVDIPKIIIHNEESKRTTEESQETKRNPLTSRAEKGRAKMRRNTTAENQRFLLSALEEIMLEPIRLQP